MPYETDLTGAADARPLESNEHRRTEIKRPVRTDLAGTIATVLN
jgi:hypothetical protein